MTKTAGSQEQNKKEFVSKFTKGYRFEPPKIEYYVTKERLTGKAGAGTMIDLFCATSQYERLKGCLPERSSNYSYDSIQYALCILTGFWLGADCLEDLEKFSSDEFLVKKLGGKIPRARSVGDWLRDFDEDLLQKAQNFLPGQALHYREHLKIKTPIVLDMDSTSHPQSGNKIEGVGWNYKNEWALDSLSTFCDAGFCYGFELRSGATFSSNGAAKMLSSIVGTIKADAKYLELESPAILYRADSAFCNEEVMNACLKLGVKFTITAHGNLKWESYVRDNTIETDWQPWEYTKEQIEESIERERPLPKVEVCSLLYTPSWAENIRFKLVVKRTLEVEEEGLFKGQGYWNYYAVITNVMDYLEGAQTIMEHHQQRGNAENRIKAFKGDYDLKHFPCLKMNANFSYGLMAMVALNFHRALSLVENPKAPTFSKSFRERLIKIPGRLVHHARAMMIKIEGHWLKEVRRLQTAWHDPPQIMLTFKLRLKTA